MMRDSGAPTRRGSFALAVLASAALVLAAPFVANLQRWLRQALGAHYVPVINAAVATMAIVAIGAAAARIRDRRARRYGLLSAAVLLAAAYAWATGLASAESNAVERFHFVAYGLITWLFYRVSVKKYEVQKFEVRSTEVSTDTDTDTDTNTDAEADAEAKSDAAADAARRFFPYFELRTSYFELFLFPLSCAMAVSASDEWLQHLAPGRIGEARDIFMNLAAIACGLLVSLGVAPPGARPRRIGPRDGRRLAVAGGLAAALIASFIYVVHVGALVQDEEVAFLSRYTAGELARRVATGAPPAASAWGIEDQYATEAVWHVQARNERWGSGDLAAAWGENRILEKYYAPVLRSGGYGWPPEQRADAERRAGDAGPRPYRSHAERLKIWPIRR